MAINFLVQNGEEALSVGQQIVMPFDAVLKLLEAFGVFRVLMPFLLIFAIIYAVLLKTKVLGKEDNSVTKTTSAIVALAISFFVIASTPVVDALNKLIPQAAFLIVVVVLFLMVLVMLGVNLESESGGLTKWAGIIALVVVILFLGMMGLILGPAVPSLFGFSQFLLGTFAIDMTAETAALVVALIIFVVLPVGIVLYMVSR